MKSLNLHSSGKRDYLVALKEKYQQLTFEIKSDLNLTEKEKEAALKALKEKYVSERKGTGFSLFLKA